MLDRRRNSGAAAWPLVARGQQAAKVWRVGYLAPGSLTKGNVVYYDAFRIKLRDLGYAEGNNFKLEVRRADDDYLRLPALAADLVSLAPDVIAATGSPATAALQRATSSIPIVMTGVLDPIGSKFVASLAKPRRQHHGTVPSGRRCNGQDGGTCCISQSRRRSASQS